MTEHLDDQLPRRAEQKRRRREFIAMAVAAVLLVSFAIAQGTLPPLSRHTSLISNLAVILLFNVSFLLLGLLLFLVSRNIAKVIFERRHGLVGSRLQARLVAGFITIALLPSAFLLFVAGSFLSVRLENWFNPEYERVLNDSLEIAQTYYLNSANDALHYARELAQEISSRGLVAPDKRRDLKHLIETKQQEFNLGTIEVFSSDRNLLVLALSPSTPTGLGVSPDSSLLARTLGGRPSTRTDQVGKSDVIRGTAPIYFPADSENVAGAVIVDYYVPKSLAKRAATISHTFEQYLQLRMLKKPIVRSYLLVLLLIGLVVVLLSSWFGMYLARGITGPIGLLARGTQAVAAGDLDYTIPAARDDEIGHLVTSFNRMTKDLRTSSAELDRRRRYTETLLKNVSAGVIALDRDGNVTTVNRCAETMLGLGTAAIGKNYREALPAPVVGPLEDFFRGHLQPDFRCAVTFNRQGSEFDLMITASALEDESGPLGSMLFFEDVSQIAKVERIEAWREVARRIAHEIKNPLTPIQLSAERLRRQLGGDGSNASPLVEECTRTIISEVEALKRLVNEFSAFARMPHLNPTPGDLNALAEEAVSNFRNATPSVDFSLKLDPQLPQIAIDREGLKRALVNLLDNAVAACGQSNGNGSRGRIEVETALDSESGFVRLEVTDNGPGIDSAVKPRIFEPYFSTKESGTGLGLAIVSAVVSDHHGFVRVSDNNPTGSRFVLEFPVKMHPPANVLA